MTLSRIALGIIGSVITFASFADANLVVTKSSNPNLVVVGQNISYVTTVSNAGPLDATDVVVTDALPAGVTLVSAPSFCTGTAVIVCTIATISSSFPTSVSIVITVVAPSVPSSINNTVSVTSSSVDPNTANNTATASTLVVAVSASADVSATLQANPASVTQGGQLTYAVFAINNGPATATNVKLSHRVNPLQLNSFVSANSPPGLCVTELNFCAGFGCIFALAFPLEANCSLGDLIPGAVAQATIIIRANLPDDQIAQAIQLLGSAFVSSDNADSDGANNKASVETTVVLPPPLPSGGGDGGGGCFIATAAFGSPLANEVNILREFRDSHLVGNLPGREFLRMYYANSPPIADFLRQHAALRAAVRLILWPVVYSIKYPSVPCAVILVGVLAVVGRYRRRKVWSNPGHWISTSPDLLFRRSVLETTKAREGACPGQVVKMDCLTVDRWSRS